MADKLHHDESLDQDFDQFNLDDDFNLDDEPTQNEPMPEDVSEPADNHKKKKQMKLSSGIVDSLLEMVRQNWLYIVIGVAALGVAFYLISQIMGGFGSSNQQQAPQQQHSLSANFNNIPSQSATAPTLQNNSAAQQAQANQTAASGQQGWQQSTTGSQQQGSATSGGELSGANVQQVTGEVRNLLESSDRALLAVVKQYTQGLKQTIADSQTQVTQKIESSSGQLMQQINQMQGTIRNLQDEVVTYKDNMDKLGAALTDTQKKLSLLLAEKAQSQEKYTLRAIVSGQAWLVTSDGETQMVTVGSDLGNYGQVVKIDATAGTVTMSSGYVFN